MTKTLFFLLALFVIFIIFFLGTVVVYPYLELQPVQPIRLSVTDAPIIENKKIVLPIDPKASYVNGFEIYYSYNFTITGFKEVPDGREVLSDIKEPFSPPFIIANDYKTFIIFEKGAERTEGTVSDLKVGQKVRNALYYNPRMQTWRMPEIHIDLNQN